MLQVCFLHPSILDAGNTLSTWTQGGNHKHKLQMQHISLLEQTHSQERDTEVSSTCIMQKPGEEIGRKGQRQEFEQACQAGAADKTPLQRDAASDPLQVMPSTKPLPLNSPSTPKTQLSPHVLLLTVHTRNTTPDQKLGRHAAFETMAPHTSPGCSRQYSQSKD